MSRFFVGQRVRIVGCEDCGCVGVIGLEAVVNELDCVSGEYRPGYIGVTLGGDDEWCFLPAHLEPITDSYDVTSWDTCVWKPEHLRVGV